MKSKIKQPKIFLLAKTRIETSEARDWLDYLGAQEYQIPNASVGAALTTLAGKRCYKSFELGLNKNLSQVRDDVVAFIENILKSRHGSVLAHVNYTFAIEGVTRVFTAEFNRHHVGVAISEGSLRYIREDEMGYRMPQCFKQVDDDLEEKRAKSREILAKAFQQALDNYKALEEIWEIDDHLYSFHEKKELTSAFRRVLPLNTVTGGVWTMNLLALRHILTVRCAPEAEEEILEVCSLILERMIQEEPEIFGDFKKVDGCYCPEYRF
jgi:thymidylate synthase (FAD)